jgi:hypothetical protein
MVQKDGGAAASVRQAADTLKDISCRLKEQKNDMHVPPLCLC